MDTPNPMPDTQQTTIPLPTELVDQVATLAQTLNISVEELIERVLAQFIQSQQVSVNDERSINQGDIYWVQLTSPDGTEPGIRHPHVVVQDNLFNHSRVETVVLCALTSNVKRASLPGNVVLEIGEANLDKVSVVEVSKIISVAKTALGEYIGTLDEHRIRQILAGLRFLQKSYFPK